MPTYARPSRHPRPLARATAALAALLLVGGWLTGLPALLWYIGGNPVPTSLPSLDDILQALTRPDDGTLLLRVLIIAGWLVWATFCGSLIMELVSRLAGRHLATQPRQRHQRRIAGLLLGAIAAIAAPTAAHAAQHPATPAADTATLHPEDDLPPSDSHETARHPRHALHLVDRGEALLDLQQRYGLPWQRIAQTNYGTIQPDGRTLQPGQTRIYPGWQMRIPTEAAPPETRPASEPGDGSYLSGADDQPDTAAPDGNANPPSGPAAGQTTAAASPQPGPQRLRYQIVDGDWMWHIADRYLGDPHRYPDIAALNPQFDARYDDFPDHIQPGDQLLLPADAHDRGEQRHATGQAAPIDEAPPAPPAERPEPTPPADSGPDTPSPPADTTPAPADTPSPATDTPPTPVPGQVPPPGDDGVVTPPPATSTPPGHTPDSPAAANDPPAADAPDSNESPDGLDIPGGGGWVALPLAAAIAAAAALAIINRRRRWRPGQDTPTEQLPQLVRHIRPPAPGPGTDEPTPEPASQPAADPTHDDADDELDRLEHAAATVSPPTVGADPQQPRQLDTLPPHGIALAGPGATAAARGLLTGALVAGGPHRPDQAAEAITTADLLADLELDDPELAGLSVATSIHHALNLLQIEINRRYHVLDDELDQPADDLPDPPLLVLLSGGIGTQHLHRLDALVNLGRHVGVRTVLLGAWPDRPTWQVAADGHTTGADQPGLRLNTFTPPAAGQILATLAEAHTEPDRHTAPPAEQPTSTSSPRKGPAPHPPAPPGAAGEADRLLLRLLGKPGAEAPGRREIKVQRAAAMHIAVYLAVHPQGANKDEILEQVLGDKTMRSASQSFDSALHQLRRALTHPGTGHSAIGRHRNGHYHLDPQVIDVDWWQLQHAADTGHPQQVLELYQGPLAHGIDQDWLAAPRQHARNLALTAHDQVATDDPDQALPQIEAALQLDPYNEHFTRRAMRIHADRGDHTAVRRVLKRLTDRLATLDAELTTETRDLATQLTTNQQKPTTVPEPAR